MEVTANTNFLHGIYEMKPGEKMEIPDVIAADLVKAGLVSENKMAHELQNKMMADVSNKKK